MRRSDGRTDGRARRANERTTTTRRASPASKRTSRRRLAVLSPRESDSSTGQSFETRLFVATLTALTAGARRDRLRSGQRARLTAERTAVSPFDSGRASKLTSSRDDSPGSRHVRRSKACALVIARRADSRPAGWRNVDDSRGDERRPHCPYLHPCLDLK